jgi:hypothetical protein
LRKSFYHKTNVCLSEVNRFSDSKEVAAQREEDAESGRTNLKEVSNEI